MKIAVCVKEVPAASRPLDSKSYRLDRSGDLRVNPRDLAAVEAGLSLGGGAENEVVLVSVGPESALETVREGLAMGAARAVVVSDPALGGSDLAPTSLVLARVLERERPDLTLFGQLAEDSSGGLIWAAVAVHLALPILSQALTLEVAATGASIRVERQTEAGTDVLEAPLPCLVSVSDAIAVPRFPTFREMKAAREKPVDALGLSDLGLSDDEVGESGSRTEVLAVSPVKRTRDALVVEPDEPAEAAREIVGFLRERGLA
jgi:electron transfer flavoprotein beta subunit